MRLALAVRFSPPPLKKIGTVPRPNIIRTLHHDTNKPYMMSSRAAVFAAYDTCVVLF